MASIGRSHCNRDVIVSSIDRSHCNREMIVASIDRSHCNREVIVASIDRSHCNREVVVGLTVSILALVLYYSSILWRTTSLEMTFSWTMTLSALLWLLIY